MHCHIYKYTQITPTYNKDLQPQLRNTDDKHTINSPKNDSRPYTYLRKRCMNQPEHFALPDSAMKLGRSLTVHNANSIKFHMCKDQDLISRIAAKTICLYDFGDLAFLVP